MAVRFVEDSPALDVPDPGCNAPESPFLSRLSTMTHYSPIPRMGSEMFTPSYAGNGCTQLAPISDITMKTVELLHKSPGSRTVRLYESYDKYFTSVAAEKGRKLKIETILNDNPYGIEFGTLGIQNGWILTQIGHDEDATKLMYSICKNRMLSLAKIGKKSGYDLTFEGDEKKFDDDEVGHPQILHSMSDYHTHHRQDSLGSNFFIDDEDDFPMLPDQDDDILSDQSETKTEDDDDKKKVKDTYIPIDRGYLIVSLRLHVGHIVAYKFLKYLKDENITDEMLSFDLYRTEYSWSLCEVFFSEIMNYDHERGKGIFRFMQKEALLEDVEM